jgi:hypothetical protein
MEDTKICKGPCGLSKSIIDFGKRTKSKDCLQFKCKTCISLYNTSYHKNNSEIINKHKREYYSENKEEMEEYYKNRYKDNRESILLRNKIYNLNNKDIRKIYNDEYRQKNSKSIKEQKRIYRQENNKVINLRHSLWVKNNLDKVNAKNTRRKTTKLNRTPNWSNQKDINILYKDAKELKKLTGINFHVDHIVPLKSKFVSAFHVVANLQILEAKENLSKGNRYWPDMPDYSTMIYDPATNTLIDKGI